MGGAVWWVGLNAEVYPAIGWPHANTNLMFAQLMTIPHGRRISYPRTHPRWAPACLSRRFKDGILF